MPAGKKVFFIHTAGDPRENQNSAIKRITDAKNCTYLGTYGPFNLIGGIAKGHPNAEEI